MERAVRRRRRGCSTREADEEHRAQMPARIVQPLDGRKSATATKGSAIHDSSALPFSANMPCGRFWMKTMMNTSTAIFASTAPCHASSNLLAKPRPSAAYTVPASWPDAAEHHHHEGVDDVALAEVGPDVADLRERAAGEAGDAGAEAERPHVDARGRHADAATPSRGSA